MKGRICPALKYCPKCQQQRPIDSFYVIKKGGYIDSLGKKRTARCKECQSKHYKNLDLRIKLYYGAKQRAKKFGYEFTITPEDIKIPTHCPVLGTELKEVQGRGLIPSMSNYTGPSLDRVDNSKGYIPGNIRVISARANCIKGNTSPAEILGLARYVTEHFNLDLSEFLMPIPPL